MDLLKTTDCEKEKILKHYNKTKEQYELLIEELKNWLNEQNFMNQGYQLLEPMLLQNKMNTTKTKLRISNLFQTIPENPDLFRYVGDKLPSTQAQIAVPLPNLTANLERVAILKIINPEKVNFDEGLIMALTLAIIMVYNNYALSGRIILDFDQFSWHIFLKLNPLLLIKLMNIHENCMAARFTGIELINTPNFIKSILNVAKMVLKPKLLARITVHENLDSLYKNVPKECLPSDYGGKLQNLAYFIDKYDKLVVNQQVNFNKIKLLLPKKPLSEKTQLNGIQGTFKQLNID